MVEVIKFSVPQGILDPLLFLIYKWKVLRVILWNYRNISTTQWEGNLILIQCFIYEIVQIILLQILHKLATCLMNIFWNISEHFTFDEKSEVYDKTLLLFIFNHTQFCFFWNTTCWFKFCVKQLLSFDIKKSTGLDYIGSNSLKHSANHIYCWTTYIHTCLT